VSVNIGDADTGLEFALMQQLAQRMGGQISVESTINQGTTFTVMLPMAKNQIAATKPNTEPNPKATPSAPKEAATTKTELPTKEAVRTVQNSAVSTFGQSSSEAELSRR